MKMGILRLRIVGVKLRKTHIGNGSPLSGACLDIAVVLVIESMLLYTIKKLEGTFEGLAISRSPRIL